MLQRLVVGHKRYGEQLIWDAELVQWGSPPSPPQLHADQPSPQVATNHVSQRFDPKLVHHLCSRQYASFALGSAYKTAGTFPCAKTATPTQLRCTLYEQLNIY
ncbi:hypothetical protein PGT21_009012 [Puccinia graminis f. sp. tritici]|uniref:Uncharacterized protein n=1 Tax=Puccinia graminis f. sp. tritici TaxID=56615 RepID=A0A5B0NGZ2_PUCGR|nr:hypothetical protein PGTUg99_031157 [Puccinia graminis f. sp. tritici]KAA1105492.1 hypothetical protein PGT21_009012 [Puccinia graminis f. sp. tritici]